MTRGRTGEVSLSNLLWLSYLPIVIADTRTAYLFMYEAHAGSTGP